MKQTFAIVVLLSTLCQAHRRSTRTVEHASGTPTAAYPSALPVPHPCAGTACVPATRRCVGCKAAPANPVCHEQYGCAMGREKAEQGVSQHQVAVQEANHQPGAEPVPVSAQQPGGSGQETAQQPGTGQEAAQQDKQQTDQIADKDKEAVKGIKSSASNLLVAAWFVIGFLCSV